MNYPNPISTSSFSDLNCNYIKSLINTNKKLPSGEITHFHVQAQLIHTLYDMTTVERLKYCILMYYNYFDILMTTEVNSNPFLFEHKLNFKTM